MPNYDDEVVVLRAHVLGEADRIVTMFGRQHGKIRAVARGVRRTTSKFGARLEPGNLLDAQFYTRRLGAGGLDTVTQVVTVQSYAGKFVDDFEVYTAASAVLEAADRLLESEPAPLQFAQLVGSLRDLARRAHPAGLIVDSYLLRALALAGWEPTFTNCTRCGRPGPHARISLATGGAVCDEDAPGSGALMTADVDTMRLLWALLAGNWRVAEASDDDTRAAATRIVAAYTQFHLERGLRSVEVGNQDRRARDVP
ncbi:DNA repair protein RecO [Gulosibacter faecalis]|jgi:DNA repair protein RecO (recombination protein O)|uniref:DNA repair protein RecO n=1 Tax=Gulosibacter faecalis TaxID=272240 RepID=A0ABW5UY24_9MICO|nr:DNA repair protein RecO [Gulosibacter faecalis]